MPWSNGCTWKERTIAKHALILVSFFFQECALEGQAPHARTEPAEKLETNGKWEVSVKFIE